MLKKCVSMFSSVTAMIAVTAVLVAGAAAATFIENDYGAETARTVVYEAPWFIAVMVVWSLILAVRLLSGQLWRNGKWPAGLFHAAFLVILAGAGLTRLAGMEGILHFREGETARSFASSDSFLQVTVETGDTLLRKEERLRLSAITSSRQDIRVPLQTGILTVQALSWIPAAEKTVLDDPEGAPVAELAVTENTQMIPVTLQSGESFALAGGGAVVFGTEPAADGTMVFRLLPDTSGLRITVNAPFSIMHMQRRMIQDMDADEQAVMQPAVVYRAGEYRLALKSYTPAGRVGARPALRHMGEGQPLPDALTVRASLNGRTAETALFRGDDSGDEERTIMLGNARISVRFGPKEISLPFGLELVDFNVERYPGSKRPSSFSSDVIIRDARFDLEKPFQIYMNHILRYRGYRFYQSSYDPDEKGSVLSVSRDPGGMFVYAGFFLLVAGLVVQLFHPGCRPGRLRREMRQYAGKVIAVFIPFFLLLPQAGLRSAPSANDLPGAVKNVDQSHIRHFAAMPMQDPEGRVKPVETLAFEISRELGAPHRRLKTDRVRLALAFCAFPENMADVPVVYIPDTAVREVLGLPVVREYASYRDFFNESGRYRLAELMRRAGSADVAGGEGTEEALFRVDGDIRFLHTLLSGEAFRIYPLEDDPEGHWVNARRAGAEGRTLHADYVRALEAGHREEADQALERIMKYQRDLAGGRMPGPFRLAVEGLYMRLAVFQRLAWVELTAGLILLVLIITGIRRSGKVPRAVFNAAGIFMIALFAAHTAGLILRWIAAGHAPWTNKYESMVYIAWTAMLAGLVYMKYAGTGMAVGSMVSGLFLVIARMDWVNPAIQPIPPVLKSHWLITHVSIITASYGFFGLGALMSLVVLSVIAGTRTVNADRAAESVRQMTRVVESALLAGIVLVSIGNILGAVWANESWGRYWGWDPKETWTFIVILVYGAILHFRLIPRLKSMFALNVASLLAFSVILMTYFGVNFYLSGLHSYAAGEAPSVPVHFMIIAAVLAAVIFAAARKRKAFE